MINKLDEAFAIYDKHLKNKKIEITLDTNEKIIIIFLKKNFLHLTGVKMYKDISAAQFYDNYKKNKLNKSRLVFDEYSKMKLGVFNNLKFELHETVKVHSETAYIQVFFDSDYRISKNSAILCIKNKYPQSLLKKNQPLQGQIIKGTITKIEPIN